MVIVNIRDLNYSINRQRMINNVIVGNGSKIYTLRGMDITEQLDPRDLIEILDRKGRRLNNGN